MEIFGDVNDCIVAISTPPGSGALAVIRLSGKDVFDVVSTVFSKDLNELPSHSIHYGFIRHEGEEIDEVMVSIFHAPRSFTTEDSVEISCHGSIYIQQKIVEVLVKQGARLARPGEFSLRAFLHGRLDLTQAEAVTDVIASGNKRSHELALRQMKGGFSKAIEELRDALIHFASMIELELDFGEEDVEFADRGALVKLIKDIQKTLLPLIDSFRLGNAIKHGIISVIAGRPNAGKSTLLNALLNEDRAIVSDIEGTTRDTIEEILNINGVGFRLIDTAGIREARDKIEAVGVEKTFEMVRNSAILLYVYDKSKLSPAQVLSDLENLKKEGSKIVVVSNKTDVFAGLPTSEQKSLLATEMHDWDELQDRFHVLPVSAKSKDGLEQLKERLYEMVSGHDQDEVIISNLRHYESLVNTNESLNAALTSIESGISGDLVALDIRHAIRHLGEITGAITTDDLLGNIFGRFCIGK
ncbi:MAG: tRNA uridine-5-carboxymethylaminomethyl(34) synthesis GTPase MnmE [Bacteroidetes bacterium]|nr:tRNA uridine-5-carboxymethylaminomethyl(34) synthesis GTPase MnmE [Bacteroidota bacterium]